MHLLHHIVDSIELYGPVYSTWMFAYERFNSWITRRVKNRRHPEATVMETYRVGYHFIVSVSNCNQYNILSL